MEILLWIAGGLIWLVMRACGRPLGLVDTDSKTLVASQSYTVLSLLKEQLYGAQVTSWNATSVSYIKDSSAREFQALHSALHFQNGTEELQLPLGEGGRCVFLLENDRLSVEVVVTDEDAVLRSNSLSVQVLPSSDTR